MARALEGLTVLDLATFVAAPFCGTLLGEFGAEVIGGSGARRSRGSRTGGSRSRGTRSR